MDNDERKLTVENLITVKDQEQNKQVVGHIQMVDQT